MPPPVVHAYGAVNVEKTRREVDKSVGELCNILESYKALSAARQEKLLPRYLSLLRVRTSPSTAFSTTSSNPRHTTRATRVCRVVSFCLIIPCRVLRVVSGW